MVGELAGLVSREGRRGGGELGESFPVRKGELDTIFNGISGSAGEMGGFTAALMGLERGGSTGGPSSAGEADLTVVTEAVDEMESELEARLSLLGLIGDRFTPTRSSVELLSFPFNFDAAAFTVIFWGWGGRAVRSS